MGCSLSSISSWCKGRSKRMSFFQQPAKDVLVGLVLSSPDTILPSAVGLFWGFPEQRGWFSGGKVAVQEQQRRREQCWARWDVASVYSQLQNTPPLGWDWERTWSYPAVLHNTACSKLPCPCYLLCPGRTSLSCSPLGLSWAEAGDPQSFMLCFQVFRPSVVNY